MWTFLREKMPSIKSILNEFRFVQKTFNITYMLLEELILNFIFRFIINFDDNDEPVINLYFDNKWHTIILPKLQRNVITSTIYDQDKNEITQDLVDKGIIYNFYGIRTTPSMLGYEKIIFKNILEDSEQSFKNNEVIDLQQL